MKNSWETVEKTINLIFPKDYKDFIDMYGEGAINDFLWVLSPFSDNENINNLKKFVIMKETYGDIQVFFPISHSFDFYNGKNGLFPWGITDNGDELFWDFQDGGIEIVVFEARYINFYRYQMSMEEFLCKILNKDIECPAFPNDFISETNYYNTI